MDPRVQAIRDDKAVGRGSCSAIDECEEDEDIVVDLDQLGITDPKEAVKWARRSEKLFLEQGLNQRWGDEDDQQKKAYDEFKKLCEENPV